MSALPAFRSTLGASSPGTGAPSGEHARFAASTPHISPTFHENSRTKANGDNKRRKGAGFCCQVPADPACHPARGGGLNFPMLAPLTRRERLEPYGCHLQL